jgi:coiled-coil domain-containing protein 6
MLQEKLDQPVTGPPSPRDMHNGDTAQNLTQHIENLRGEVSNLKDMLRRAQVERKF